MAYTAEQIRPWIVEVGGGRIIDDTWLPDDGSGGGNDYGQSEFLAYSPAGTVSPIVAASTDYAGAVGIHAFSIEAFDDSDAQAHLSKVPVFQIAYDTIFAAQLAGGTAPAQTDIGDRRDLFRGAAVAVTNQASYHVYQIFTDAATSAAVQIVDIWLNKFPHDSSADEAGAYGIVYFKILATEIDAEPTTPLS